MNAYSLLNLLLSLLCAPFLLTVINRTMAKQYFPNENPLGRRVRASAKAGPAARAAGRCFARPRQ